MKEIEKQLILRDKRTPASTINRDANAIAGWLSLNGVGDSDVVGVLAWNDTVYFTLAQACALIGTKLLPLNWQLTRPELDYVIQDSGARCLFGHSELLAKAGLESRDNFPVVAIAAPIEIVAMFPGFRGDQPAELKWIDWSAAVAADSYAGPPPKNRTNFMFYTSGTTGKPKGVVRQPVRDDVARMARERSVIGFGLAGAKPGEVAIACCPLYHSAPFAHAMISWNAGLDVVIMPRFDAEEFLKLASRYEVGYSHLVPTMFIRLLELPEDIRSEFDAKSLIAIAHGAAPCSIPVKRRMIEWWGPVILEYYAGTETGIVVASTSQEWLERPGSIGRAIGGSDIRVIDEDGLELTHGEVGNLIIQTEATKFLRYHGREETPFVKGWDGYLWLGDIGRIDLAGFIFLTDRSSDVIIAGGSNIYPAEIEIELAMVDGIVDCGVFGVPVPDLGEGVIALVERSPGAGLEETDILKALSSKLARYKLPRRIIFVDKMPREESGKLKKRELRRLYSDALTGSVQE